MPRRNREAEFMRAALAEAQRGVGQTSPNPAVGAVLVISNRIVARGHHRRAGAPHAEVECLTRFGRTLPDKATLYVTLEPCSTTGRTPPCTKALVGAGLKRIVVGTLDPNPKHSGRGIEWLKKQGVDVRVGVLSEECEKLNPSYNKWIRTRLPFVIAKCGMSLDGRLTAPPRESQWLTSPKSRRHAQALRARVDAILVGAETVRSDNPQLTVRGKRGARQPWRVVLSTSGKLPRSAKIFRDRFADRTLVHGKTRLSTLLRELGDREITSILIEGGGDILGQALDEQLIDYVQMYLASVFTGGPTVAFPGSGASSTQEAPRLTDVQYEKIGEDICISGNPIYASSSPE